MEFAGKWRVTSYSISPDGRLFSENLLKREPNEVTRKIVIRHVWRENVILRTVSTSSSVSPVKWLTNHRIVYVQSGPVTKIIETDVLTGQTATILRCHNDVELGAWNPRKRLLAYSYSIGWKWGTRVSVRMRDVYSTMHYIEPSWARQTITRIAVIKLGKNIGSSVTP